MTDLNLSMFRAYDIRTPASRLTPELAIRLAEAEAVYFRDRLRVPGILLARDARRSGPSYLTLMVEVFRRAGLQVLVMPEVASTSMFYYASMCHPDHGAIMVGASHNPAEDTGQKLLAPGVAPIARGIGPEGGLDAIARIYAAGEAARGAERGCGTVRAVDVMNAYIGYSMRLAGVEPGMLDGLAIFQDYLHGAAGREMMLAFERAGASLTPLHFVPDGDFPLGDPNPVKQGTIDAGLRAMRERRHRLAMFFDGDGDRLDVYRGDGSYLSSSFVYAAILPEIRARFVGEGQGVFADLKCNPLAVMEMARAGVTVDVIRNGHSQIKESLMRDPTHFGAVEESAHFYESFFTGSTRRERFCTENTLYFALMIARVWHEHPERFDRFLNIQNQTAREREWGYKFPTDAAREAALAAVRDHFVGRGAAALERMKNGMDLEATLMRRGLPFDVDESTRLAPDWFQVCQRVSQSEDRLARWEVVAATRELAAEAKAVIASCARAFGAGEEYQG